MNKRPGYSPEARERARIIAKEIYDKAAPVPDLTPSPDQNKFLREVLALVEATCKKQHIRLE